MPQRIRARTLMPSIAALLIGIPLFLAGDSAISVIVPVGVARGVATFLLLVAVVGLVGFTRAWVARAIARREARPSA